MSIPRGTSDFPCGKPAGGSPAKPVAVLGAYLRDDTQVGSPCAGPFSSARVQHLTKGPGRGWSRRRAAPPLEPQQAQAGRESCWASHRYRGHHLTAPGAGLLLAISRGAGSPRRRWQEGGWAQRSIRRGHLGRDWLWPRWDPNSLALAARADPSYSTRFRRGPEAGGYLDWVLAIPGP